MQYSSALSRTSQGPTRSLLFSPLAAAAAASKSGVFKRRNLGGKRLCFVRISAINVDRLVLLDVVIKRRLVFVVEDALPVRVEVEVAHDLTCNI